MSVSQAVKPQDLGVPWLPLVLARVSGSYDNKDHHNFTSRPRREQDTYYVGFGLFMTLKRNLFADFSYSYIHEDSNRAEFSTRRNVVMSGITYRF